MADDGPIFTVMRIPTGPEDSSPDPEVLFEGPKSRAVYHYQEAREMGDGTGRALVLIDDSGQSVYACS